MLSKSKSYKLSLFFISLVVFGLYYFLRIETPKGLKINEISFTQNDGWDWIEIYNPSIKNISLKGFYVTDDVKNYKKFQITEDIIIPNQGFVILHGKETKTPPQNSVAFNFNISNGETIFLVSEDGSSVVDSLTAIAQEEPTGGSSIGRFPDGFDQYFIMTKSSQGQKNKKDFLQKNIKMEIEENQKKLDARF